MIMYAKKSNEDEKAIKGRCIRSKINALDDYRYIAILTEYYINCQRWEDIAESMEMSVRHTLRLHGEALQAFRKKFDFS